MLFEPCVSRRVLRAHDEEHLTSIGRRKLTKDLYEELAKTPEGLARARAIYVRARPLYQVVLRGQIDALLSGRAAD